MCLPGYLKLGAVGGDKATTTHPLLGSFWVNLELWLLLRTTGSAIFIDEQAEKEGLQRQWLR